MGFKKIEIDPITRVEGHGKISLFLGKDGRVEDAHFHVTQFRGFEKLCEGRPATEMPSLMARICGICPVSHLIASAKACDAIMAVKIPNAAVKLRRIMNQAQMVQSHALSFFHLTSPDLLLGMDADPAERNILGVLKKYPDLARDGIRLRQFGQQIIEMLGNKRIHPAWIVPGGVNEPLSQELRDKIHGMIPEAYEIIERTLDWFKRSLDKYREEIRTFANFPSLFLGLVNSDKELEHYDGRIRVVDAAGHVVADRLDPTRYMDYLGEAVLPHSYMKAPYYKPKGFPEGMYRVGALARMNIIDGIAMPRANQEWVEFQALERGATLSSFQYHYARLIEILHGVEKIEQMVTDEEILSKHVRAFAKVNSLEGVGVSEAPRGLLIHHYKVNEEGLITWANLIVATGHNNLAMSKGILQVAKHFVDGKKLTEGMLNRVEAVVRAFDPCLSCSTHAVGNMPLHVELHDAEGNVVDEVKRG